MMAGGGPFKCAPGQVTDDGELTMSLAWVRLTASLSEPPSVTRGAPRVHIDPHLSVLHRESRSPDAACEPARGTSWASEMPTVSWCHTLLYCEICLSEPISLRR